MKITLGSWIHRYWKKFGIFLITVVLVMGLASCEGSCGDSSLYQYVLSIFSTLGGETTPGVGTFTYGKGKVVNLVAIPASGYRFVEWTGNISTIADVYAVETTITINGNYSIKAEFVAIYDLTISSTVGGETTPGSGTSTYDEGTVVDLVAEAEAGYRFVEWTGNVSTIADVYAASTNITINGNYSITANFVAIYDLTISSTVGGETTPGAGTSTHDAGTVVNLVATPDAGYRFVEWTGNVATIANVTAASTTITMNGDYSITAEFAWQYYLSVNSTAGGSVNEPGEGVFPCDEGSVVDLVAEADESYHFVQWTGNVSTIANVSAASTTITMNSNYSITANFILFAGGSGTAGNPYQIADWRQLDNVRNYRDAHFIVINDLDLNSIGYTGLASATANEGKGWQPIGTNAVNDTFVGSFDGQGYEIRDLFIDRPDEPDVGLFGVLDTVGVIENVGVVNGDVTGNNNTGGLVGKNQGSVSNSYATGNVTGDDNVGGLVGWNFDGTVTGSYATGSVTGLSNVGGLVGWTTGNMSNSYAMGGVTGNTSVGGLTGKNGGTASNSYATGSVTGDDNVGGLVGKNDNAGTVSNSYSTGNVTGNTHVGGLMGRNQGTESNSFWDTQTSGQGSSSGGTGKNTTEMKDIDTFTGAGWDIVAVDNSGARNTSYIWNIVDHVTYAFLSWQPV